MPGHGRGTLRMRQHDEQTANDDDDDDDDGLTLDISNHADSHNCTFAPDISCPIRTAPHCVCLISVC